MCITVYTLSLTLPLRAVSNIYIAEAAREIDQLNGLQTTYNGGSSINTALCWC